MLQRLQWHTLNRYNGITHTGDTYIVTTHHVQCMWSIFNNMLEWDLLKMLLEISDWVLACRIAIFVLHKFPVPVTLSCKCHLSCLTWNIYSFFIDAKSTTMNWKLYKSEHFKIKLMFLSYWPLAHCDTCSYLFLWILWPKHPRWWGGWWVSFIWFTLLCHLWWLLPRCLPHQGSPLLP